MTFEEVIKAAVPDATPGFCEHVLWGRTPFPMGQVTARSLWLAARRTYRAAQNNIYLCDLCDNRVRRGQFNCRKCQAVLDGAARSNEKVT